MVWLAQENERWRSVHDAQRDRRAPVVKALVQAFGRWQGAAISRLLAASHAAMIMST